MVCYLSRALSTPFVFVSSASDVSLIIGFRYTGWTSCALKFKSEPVSILLENQRSETNGEGHTHSVLFV